jgi:acid phosphatase
LFTNSYAITHPSEPNYLALFAGSTFGLSSDACPTQFSPPDLGSQLSAQHLSFAGYSEGMPAAGYTGCFSPSPRVDSYRRDHNPWADFSDTVGAQTNLPFTSFPTDFTTLPTVSFIVPSGQDDMHSGSVSTGDTWLKTHLDRYVQWAKANDSLLVLTWDEDNFTSVNHIPTIFVGAHVKVAYRSPTTINHYSVLRTLEAIYGLGCLRNACSAATITDVWM